LSLLPQAQERLQSLADLGKAGEQLTELPHLLEADVFEINSFDFMLDAVGEDLGQ